MLTPRFSYLLLCLRDKEVELLPEARDDAAVAVAFAAAAAEPVPDAVI